MTRGEPVVQGEETRAKKASRHGDMKRPSSLQWGELIPMAVRRANEDGTGSIEQHMAARALPRLRVRGAASMWQSSFVCTAVMVA